MTAVSQLQEGLPTWRAYLSTAVYWNVEFSYLRHRFFRLHGPMWFAPTDEGCTKLNDSVERIEYLDPFPDEFMARLRRLYGQPDDPTTTPLWLLSATRASQSSSRKRRRPGSSVATVPETASQTSSVRYISSSAIATPSVRP